MFQRLLPLYLFIVGGWFLGRSLKVDSQAPAQILTYFTVPIVIFCGIVESPLVWSEFSIPPLIFIISSALCLLALKIGQLTMGEGPLTRLLAFGAGNANSGYFGLPIALSLFGADIVGLAALFFVGFITYENTVAFYVLARGKYTVRESLSRLLRLPAIYAVAAGLVMKIFDWGLPSWMHEASQSARGTYSVLGMMMLGLAIAPVKKLRLDFRYFTLALVFKFLMWPLIAIGVVTFDRFYLHWMQERSHSLMLLFSAVPLAGNTVAFSALLKIEPEMAAIAVFLSTLLGLISIPLILKFAVLN